MKKLIHCFFSWPIQLGERGDSLITIMVALAVGAIVSGLMAKTIANTIAAPKDLRAELDPIQFFSEVRSQSLAFDARKCNDMLYGNLFYPNNTGCDSAAAINQRGGCPIGLVHPFDDKTVAAEGQTYNNFKITDLRIFDRTAGQPQPITLDLGYGAGLNTYDLYLSRIRMSYQLNRTVVGSNVFPTSEFNVGLIVDHNTNVIQGCSSTLASTPAGANSEQLQMGSLGAFRQAGQGVGPILQISKFGKPTTAGPPLANIIDTSGGTRYKVDVAVPRALHWDTSPFDPIRIQIAPQSGPTRGRFSVNVVAYVTIDSGCNGSNGIVQQVQYDILSSPLANIDHPTVAFSAAGRTFNYYTHNCDFEAHTSYEIPAQGIVGLNSGDVLQIKFSNLSLGATGSSFDGWSVTVTELP